MTRRRIRRVVAVLLVLAAALVAWALVSSVRAKSDVVKARDVLENLRDDDEPLDEDAARRSLRRAADLLDRARDRLTGPAPRIVARVPLAGRSVRALTVTAEVADHTVRDALDLLDVVAGRSLLRDGRIDVAVLRSVGDRLDAAALRGARDARRLDRLNTAWTPSPVKSGVRDARRVFGEAADALRRGADLVDGVLGVVGASGQRRLLFVLENNAELRGTGGLVSVFAEADALDGRLRVGSFRDIDDIADHREDAVRVTAPADYVAMYGRFLANTTLWKNANMSPHGPASFGVMAELFARTGGRRPDGVVALDVPAIAAILDATGPAVLPDKSRLTADNAVRKLLVDAYADVPDTRSGQAERRRRLREAADAVIQRLLDGGASGVRVGTALARATAGRHLQLWSARPGEQDAIASSGAGGAVSADGGDLAMVTIQNFGGGKFEGNKLDYYARRTMRVRVEVGADTVVTRQEFTLSNEAPRSGLTGYVAGLERPGETRNYVQFAVPKDATLRRWEREGDAQLVEGGDEGDYRVLTSFVALDPGEESTWVVEYSRPRRGAYQLRLVPQPLAADARLNLRITADGVDVSARRGQLRLDEDWTSDLHIEVAVRDKPWWSRLGRALREFWTEPVG